MGGALGVVVLQGAVNDMANFDMRADLNFKLTFGSFRVFGVLKVAKTAGRGVVVVKPLGDALPTSLADKEEPR